MAVEMIGGPRLCEPLLATGLRRFASAASRHANGSRKRTSPHWRRIASASATGKPAIFKGQAGQMQIRKVPIRDFDLRRS